MAGAERRPARLRVPPDSSACTRQGDDRQHQHDAAASSGVDDRPGSDAAPEVDEGSETATWRRISTTRSFYRVQPGAETAGAGLAVDVVPFSVRRAYSPDRRLFDSGDTYSASASRSNDSAAADGSMRWMPPAAC